MFGAQVVRDRDPVILQLANTWLILNDGGGPTADKPTVTLTTPRDPDTVSAFLNIRVADIYALQREWTARGAHFLTDPVEHPSEFRSYIRDPDGHLIEVGQSRTACIRRSPGRALRRLGAACLLGVSCDRVVQERALLRDVPRLLPVGVTTLTANCRAGLPPARPLPCLACGRTMKVDGGAVETLPHAEEADHVCTKHHHPGAALVH